MKKYIVSLVTSFAVLALAVTFSMSIQSAQAQTANCPVGYTCTPIATQPVGCPIGYTCTPVSTPPVVSTPPSTTNSCYSLPTNLYLGSTGDTVTNVQTWLTNNGFDIPAISSGKTATGYYGSQTVSAISRYKMSSRYLRCLSSQTPLSVPFTAPSSTSTNPTSQTPTIVISANGQNPLTVSSAQSVTFNYSSTNAQYCTRSGGTSNWANSNNLAVNSGQYGLELSGIIPIGATTFTVTCYSSSGASASASLVVSVTSPSPIPSPIKDTSPYVGLSINGISDSVMTVTENTDLTLSWNAVNASYCNTSGGFSNWSATNRPTYGSAELKDLAQVSSIFTITCYDNNGSYGTDSIKVNVQEGTPPVVSFTANNATSTLVIKDGTGVTFSWNATNANSCSTSGGPSGWPATNRPLSGSAELRDPIQVSQTFTLTCSNLSGISTSNSIRVNVTE